LGWDGNNFDHTKLTEGSMAPATVITCSVRSVRVMFLALRAWFDWANILVCLAIVDTPQIVTRSEGQ
jgi:hypothetical protein